MAPSLPGVYLGLKEPSDALLVHGLRPWADTFGVRVEQGCVTGTDPWSGFSGMHNILYFSEKMLSYFKEVLDSFLSLTPHPPPQKS